MTLRDTRSLEHRLGDAARARLPLPLAEFALFVLKQGWACLFGGLMLAAIIGSKLIWQPDWPLHRYDALFLFALATQAAFLWLKLETWEEARVILLFHLTGTAMEWFKVAAGSWDYPEPALLKLMGVPLFSGFMYAAVGSYIARVIRIFDMRFTPYPPFALTLILALAIYANFFAHHYLPDIRFGLFAATLILFARTRVWFRITDRHHWMPMPLAAFLAALALWIAENVGTLTGTWLYSGQVPGQLVSLGKLGSWYLLLYVSFATVTVVSRGALGGPAPGPQIRPA
ncbi:DUF817 domain-containing protein [Tabrizicola sp. TH137]|uniref:DUF817 domain-containing protein n=1 Tax=Tabrizicola sp. TH137 TaxID=2067452 RepID=UPI000C7DF850|nr:DUF817 domain-containing protein [Tabrizicola sp. TH137]PLL12622.1 DUF817 domain-containing protein [Tabrizicola sp. TH137]